jgi:hypothetical protein
MLKEDDENFQFMFSYVGNREVIIQLGIEHFVREEDFHSGREVLIFRKEVKPWIDAGMIRRVLIPIEEKFHYSLTSYGEKYYKSLNPVH